MQDQLFDFAIVAFFERNLCVDDLVEEFRLRFGKSWNFSLTGGLGHQLAVFNRDRDGKQHDRAYVPSYVFSTAGAT